MNDKTFPTMKENDAELLNQYRTGNAAALEQIVERYRRSLFGFILNMTGNREEANDIFQETWFRAIKNIHKYRHDNLAGWLFKIARNCIIDRSRSGKKTVSLDSPGRTGASLGDTVPCEGVSPSAEAGNRETGRKIADAVAALPARQREVFLLRMEGGLPFRDIAAIQRVSINTALARMQYALAKLRHELKDEYTMAGSMRT